MSYIGKLCLQKNVNGIRISNFFICSTVGHTKLSGEQRGVVVTERVGLSGTQLVTVPIYLISYIPGAGQDDGRRVLGSAANIDLINNRF